MLCDASARYVIWRAVLDTLPLSVAVIPWGILTGALTIQVGFSPLAAQCMSLLVFAGAAQLSAITLVGGGSSILSIYASGFVISSRHLLYSITFRQHVQHLPLRWRLAIAFVLTDEMFAVSEAHTANTGTFSPSFALASGFSFYLVWNLATLLGIIAGESFGHLESLGLDFAIAATFIAMTFDQVRKMPVAMTMLVSGVLAVFLQPVLPDSYLIFAALAGMVVGYLLDSDVAPT
ncbi:branched-chain amino acid ABC transporter permease [Arenicella chitinivorans]|uniref:Branched-chain amino acid ABC transporter permease n=1 Tax=Arenicella chitinivorans TaxID=1329800 RepID=A0A918VJW1_9GAMM|nr:AzlC family ABC transporter permease [Arenicella chitinivorans]GHA02051.1 branched-chain amino acid ABC transporter permease [Arenicella chitinivorans]